PLRAQLRGERRARGLGDRHRADEQWHGDRAQPGELAADVQHKVLTASADETRRGRGLMPPAFLLDRLAASRATLAVRAVQALRLLRRPPRWPARPWLPVALRPLPVRPRRRAPSCCRTAAPAGPAPPVRPVRLPVR